MSRSTRPNSPPPNLSLLPLPALLALAACAAPSLPEGSGRGLLSHDRRAPDGVVSHPLPRWQVGDRFVYRRGELLRLPFRVTDAGDDGYVIEHEESGHRQWLTAELGQVGERQGGVEAWSRRDDPADVQLHWPLWEGKRWACHLLRKAPGAPALPLIIDYRCEGTETIEVPAGTFECLRIWRRARVAAEGNYLVQTALLWYSPQVGWFARRLENSVMVELEDYQRQ